MARTRITIFITRSAVIVACLLLAGCLSGRRGDTAAPTATTEALPVQEPSDVAHEAEQDGSTAPSAADNATAEVYRYEDYRFKPGDEIEISVWGEEMTQHVLVQPDGKISYYLIGEVQVVGLTFKELREELERRLARYILDPKVTIIGKSFAGNFVTVLGAVDKPGRHIISQTDRVLDVIASAGGLKFMETDDLAFAGDIANLKLAYLSRGGRLMDVDFEALLKQGNMTYNLPVEVGDFVYIPSTLSEKIFVLGEVNVPRSLPFRGDTTVLEALASAGGFNEVTARKGSIAIVRGSLKDPQLIKVDFERIRKGKDLNILLEPGDIVYVSSTIITDVERFTTQLIPFLDSVIKGDEVVDIVQRRWDTWNPYRNKQ